MSNNQSQMSNENGESNDDPQNLRKRKMKEEMVETSKQIFNSMSIVETPQMALSMPTTFSQVLDYGGSHSRTVQLAHPISFNNNNSGYFHDGQSSQSTQQTNVTNPRWSSQMGSAIDSVTPPATSIIGNGGHNIAPSHGDQLQVMLQEFLVKIHNILASYQQSNASWLSQMGSYAMDNTIINHGFQFQMMLEEFLVKCHDIEARYKDLKSKNHEKDAQNTLLMLQHEEYKKMVEEERVHWNQTITAHNQMLHEVQSTVTQLENRVQVVGLRALLMEAGLLSVMNMNAARRSQADVADDESSSIPVAPFQPIWPICKLCNLRFATMMLLPCQHMVLCKNCEVVSSFCPACNEGKIRGIEVLLPQE